MLKRGSVVRLQGHTGGLTAKYEPFPYAVPADETITVLMQQAQSGTIQQVRAQVSHGTPFDDNVPRLHGHSARCSAAKPAATPLQAGFLAYLP